MVFFVFMLYSYVNHKHSFIIMKNISKLLFLLVLTFVGSLAKAQSVDFQITGYSATAAGVTFTVQVKASTTGVVMPNITMPITFSSNAVTNFGSKTFDPKYNGYTGTESYNNPNLNLNIVAPGSPVTISTSWEDFITVTMGDTGTTATANVVSFGIITGLTVSSAIGTTATFLPVKFVSFTANTVGDEIILNWATATETNNELFEVERSIDGINFVPIGTQKGANNSNNIRKYSYVDASKVTTNVIYYRVKQVDYDKNNSYSNVAVVKMLNSKSVIAIFPNPANNTINVVFKSYEKNLTTITLSDNIGSVIKSFDVSSTVGENKYEIDISEIPKGIYVINLIVAGNRHAIRFIKN